MKEKKLLKIYNMITRDYYTSIAMVGGLKGEGTIPCEVQSDISRFNEEDKNTFIKRTEDRIECDEIVSSIILKLVKPMSTFYSIEDLHKAKKTAKNEVEEAVFFV